MEVETKSCRILTLAYAYEILHDLVLLLLSYRLLETKSGRILPLTYCTKYDLT